MSTRARTKTIFHFYLYWFWCSIFRKSVSCIATFQFFIIFFSSKQYIYLFIEKSIKIFIASLLIFTSFKDFFWLLNSMVYNSFFVSVKFDKLLIFWQFDTNSISISNYFRKLFLFLRKIIKAINPFSSLHWKSIFQINSIASLTLRRL